MLKESEWGTVQDQRLLEGGIKEREILFEIGGDRYPLGTMRNLHRQKTHLLKCFRKEYTFSV